VRPAERASWNDATSRIAIIAMRKMSGGRVIRPPITEAGRPRMAKGYQSRVLSRPVWTKRTTPIAETSTVRASATGLIAPGAKPAKLITAT